mgnify:CR=1 FL=1
MAEIVYLNGDYIEKSSAKISVLDRGFLFGDGIYEVIPVYAGKAFRLTEHLSRLDYCANVIGLNCDIDHNTWQTIIETVIERNGGGNLSIYLQLTRGVTAVRNHAFPKKTPPTLLVMSSPLNVDIKELSAINVTLLNDIRWQHCNIKSTSLLGGILLNQQAHALGFSEAILHRDGLITEATTSNVFIVNNGTIFTPNKSQYLLGGITRDLIIELAIKHHISVVESDVKMEQLAAADEVWISSSSREISAVTQIDDKIVGNGNIGKLTIQMHQIFQSFKQSLIQND